MPVDERMGNERMDNIMVGWNDGYVFTQQYSQQLTQSSARSAAVTAQGIAHERDRRRKEGR